MMRINHTWKYNTFPFCDIEQRFFFSSLSLDLISIHEVNGIKYAVRTNERAMQVNTILRADRLIRFPSGSRHWVTTIERLQYCKN